MSNFSNTHCERLTPTSIRDAIHHIRELRDTPVLVYNRMYLNPHLDFDWERLVHERPGVAQSIRLSARENNGDVILPLAVYNDLLDHGLLVWVESEEE